MFIFNGVKIPDHIWPDRFVLNESILAILKRREIITGNHFVLMFYLQFQLIITNFNICLLKWYYNKEWEGSHFTRILKQPTCVFGSIWVTCNLHFMSSGSPIYRLAHFGLFIVFLFFLKQTNKKAIDKQRKTYERMKQAYLMTIWLSL